MYIYSGKDLYRLESGMKDKIHKLGVDRDHIVTIDADNRRDFEIEKVLMECDTFSLFDSSSNKAVIVKNPYFLNASGSDKGTKSKKKTADPMLDKLEKYLRNPNPTTELFFYCHGYDADSRKKEYKLLEKYGAVTIQFKQMNEREFGDYARNELKRNGITISSMAMQELLDRCALNTLRLHQAIEKLVVYGDLQPDDETVYHVVPQNDEVDAFRLSNMFTGGNLKGTIEAYRKMKRNNEQTARMIASLAGALRRLYNMKLLYEEGLSEESIATRLHVKNEWAIRYGLRNGSRYNAHQILRLLNELADLDQGVKAGLIDADDGFEDFLIRNVK